MSKVKVATAAAAMLFAMVVVTGCAYDPVATEISGPSVGEVLKNGEPQTYTEADNAVKSAEQYLRTLPFSQDGLAEQLMYEGYTQQDAQNAVNSVEVDWNAQAVKKGQSYLNIMPMSQQELHDQLLYEKFTPEQAQFAVGQLFVN